MIEKVAAGLLLLCFIAETFALHIVVSPDEAAKLMKRDDQFSKGLAGFIDEKLSEKKHKETRSDKISEIKSMIKELMNKDKKEASPPALPLDTQAREISNLETMVSNLLQEVRSKRKREQDGWVHWGKKEAEKEEVKQDVKDSAKDSDSELENLYKRLKEFVNKEEAKDSSAANSVTEETIITDSGVAKDDMKRSKGKDDELVSKLDKLAKEVAEKAKVSHSNVGEMTLNAIKKMIAEKKKTAGVKRSESKVPPMPPQTKMHDGVASVDDLLNEVQALLRKYKPKSRKSGEKSDEVMKEEVAVEVKSKSSKVKDKRRELLKRLIKSYNALLKTSTNASDDVEDELEKLSKNLEKKAVQSRAVSKETEKAMKGFDINVNTKRSSHPK